MAEPTKINPNLNKVELLGDILTDVQVLVQKEIELARRDIKDDIEGFKPRVKAFLIGILLSILSIAFVANALVHLLVTEAHIALWVSHLIVGAGLLLIGSILGRVSMFSIKKKVSELKPPGLVLKGGLNAERT